MAHRANPATPSGLGTISAGWLSFANLLTGIATPDASRPVGSVGGLRGLIRRVARINARDDDFSDMPAYLLADIGRDPRDARPEPLMTQPSDAAAWVAIKSGIAPRM